jgi:diacylglycerol kinase (ATP)
MSQCDKLSSIDGGQDEEDMAMNTLFLVNPVAGRGKGRQRWKTLAHDLSRQACFPFEVCFTSRPGESEVLAREAVGRYERIVVVGGDGTMNEVVNGVVGSDIAVGVIPCGTGNDLARALAIPRSNRGVLRMLNQPREVLLDVAQVNDRYFVIAAGIGFDAIVADYINRHSTVKNLGPIGYAYSAFKILTSFQSSEVTIHIDGETLHLKDVWMLAVGNCPYYAGGMKLFPNARFDDGVLNVCIVANLNKLRFLRLFPLVYSGQHVRDTRVVTALRGRAVDVEFPAHTFAHVDGEPLPSHALCIRVSPRPIRFLTAPTVSI